MPKAFCDRCKDEFDRDELIRGKWCECCWELRVEEREGRLLAVDEWMQTMRRKGGWWHE